MRFTILHSGGQRKRYDIVFSALFSGACLIFRIYVYLSVISYSFCMAIAMMII